MAQKYGSKDLVVLEGLDAVRMRPGMYIGTTGSKGMHHLLWEIVDNSIDEITNGNGDTIEIVIKADNSIRVADNGRGIPVDIHPTQKVSGVELVFTKLHAGGKFDDKNYSFSGGLHGVGASVANALSSFLNVQVHKGGKIYEMSFESKEVDGKIKSGTKASELQIVGKTDTTGTTVHFLPDARIFGKVKWDFSVIERRLKELAFLNKGLKIILTDERIIEQQPKNHDDEEEHKSEKSPTEQQPKGTVIYHYEGGITDFCKYLNEGKTEDYKEPIYISTSSDMMKLEAAFQHTDSYNENIFSYVNNIPTTEGGTHETGLKSALTKCLNDIARARNFLKDKELNFVGEDFREGLTCVLSIRMKNIQFEGQTKTKLGNPEAKQEVEQLIISELTAYLNEKANDKVTQIVLQKARAAANVREASRKAKEITRQKNSIDGANLVGKLSSCTSKKSENNELFIVEGDSAGGTAKQARDRVFQAILPLRGKPLNAEKKRLNQVLANEEIRTIISALGAGIGEDLDMESLKYHKIVILSDADQDGAHIRAILLTFFFRYMKELVAEGKVYIGMPPLYKVYKKNEIIYAYDEEDLEAAANKLGRGYQVQRYKGLGEMDAKQLWDTTMNPKSRTLVRVGLDDATEADRIVNILMGDNVELRKDYIFEHAQFNAE